MNIFRLLFELFLVYLLYKLVVDFIIPVYRTSVRMKRKVNEMHSRTQQPPQQQQQSPANSTVSKKPVEVEDIDYEEIK